MNDNVKIIGVTYFSVLQDSANSNKYVMHKKQYKDYVDNLFSEKRLDLKSKIFFDISVPSLHEMDKDGCQYKHYVLYSKQLPEKYKQKIHMAERNYSFLEGIEISNYSSFDIKDIIQKNVDKGDIFAYFNLDDDDILSIDYLQKIKRFVNPSFKGFNISLSKGYVAFYNDKISYCREVRFPFINIGQARICERKSDGRVVVFDKGNHMRTDEKCPTVVDSTSPTFFWLKHKEQDTFSQSKSGDIALKIIRSLEEYPLPKESVLKKFPVLEKYILVSRLESIGEDSQVLLNQRKERKNIFSDIFNTRGITGNIKLSYKLKNLDGSSKKQALVLFHFNRELSEEEVAQFGLLKSSMGYYRYLVTNDERVTSSFEINITNGVFLTNIETTKWGNESILIEVIKIQEVT